MKYSKSLLASYIVTIAAICRLLLLDSTPDIDPENEVMNQEIIDNIPTNVPDMVRSYGYKIEEHSIVSQDGYITTLHRIPHGLSNNATGDKPVVLLAHCMMASSAVFTVNNMSLAYLLAEQGKDPAKVDFSESN